MILIQFFWNFIEFLETKKPPEKSEGFFISVDSQGFEPRQTVPKTVVLPLHHESIPFLVVQI